ncbi:MAG: T9SS type B sorting domain-containing protein [Aureispira sp.]
MLRTYFVLCLLLPFYVLAQKQHPDQFYAPSSATTASNLKVIPADFTNHYNQKMLRRHPRWRQQAEQLERLWQQEVTGNGRSTPGIIHTLPVVVHVIHNNGLSNISKAQVRRGIEQLNEAFANTGVYNPNTGVDTEIQFCFAHSTPTGVWTDGINYVQSNLAIMDPTTDDAALKNLVQWDANNYINIWVVEEALGNNIEGYATSPVAHGSNRDGIVIEWQNIGLTAFFTKKLVHEMGHYLGLLNLYDGGGCVNNDCTADGDKVCDTPPAGNSFRSNSCFFQVNTCFADEDDTSLNNPFRAIALGGLGEQADMLDNYMNVFLVECVDFFTQGQADRMDFFLHNSRASLLTSTACQSACIATLATPSFTLSSPTATVGIPINFTNTSTNATTYEWYVEGASIGTSLHNSYTFTATGTYWVTLEARTGNVECTDRDSILVEVYCATGCNEICDNGIDDNGDGLIDCLDPTCACSTCSGKEGNNWHFGIYGALNFDSGTPELVYGSNLTNLEACASMSDPNGNLLFYTDGRTVWNRNNDVMVNGGGLAGNFSNSNILIIPKPNDPTMYYIFIPDYQSSSRGLTYSEVDLSQNRSLGAVTRKNIRLMSGIQTTEHITAIKHCDNINYWVMVKEWESNNYYSFFVTPTGIASIPFIQTIGQAHSAVNGGNANMIGNMRTNVAGTKMAINFYESQGFETYDIDRRTSQLSNPTYCAINQRPYGLEFSPNGDYLYLTVDSSYQFHDLYQYDLTLSTPTAIVNTAYLVQRAGKDSNIRLGPDGKIYQTIIDSSYLNAITQPNNKGIACAHQEKAVDLWLSRNSYGLPNTLPEQMFGAPIDVLTGQLNLCTKTTPERYQIVQNVCSGIQNVTWQHYGPNSITNTTDSTIFLLPTMIGKDTLVAAVTTSCTTITDTLIITTNAIPVLDLGGDTSFCQGQSFLVEAGNDFDNYQWSDGSQATNLTVTTAGQYWVEATSVCGGIQYDTIVVDFLVPPILGATINGSGMDQATVVAGNSFNVEAGADQRGQGVQYNWTNNGQGTELVLDSFATPTTTGEATVGQYELYVTAAYAIGCAQTDTIWLTVEGPDFLGVPNAFTPNGDGSNDAFAPVGLSVDHIKDFKIYNRWGNLVYNAPKGEMAWDGTFQGKEQPVDLYIYYLSYQLPGQEVMTLRGEVTLIR